jgi:hypothetical protein
MPGVVDIIEGITFTAGVYNTYTNDQYVLNKYVPTRLDRYVDGVKSNTDLATTNTIYNQEKYDIASTLGLTLAETTSLQASVSAKVVISAKEFGISTSSANNATALAAIATAIVAASTNGFDANATAIIEFPPGVFLVDGAIMDLTYRGTGIYTPHLIFRGAGQGVTIFRSTSTSTAAAVIEVRSGFAAYCVFEDFSIDPRTDIEQDIMHVIATRRSLDSTGGLSYATFTRIEGRSRKGEGIVFVGGDDYQSPNQFLRFEMCHIDSDMRAALRTMGQFGQATISGGEYSSNISLSSCPAIQLTQDLRQCVTAVADITNNFVTSSLEVPSGTPVRIVGTSLPSGLSTGVTYYVRRYDVAQATNDATRLSIHSSRANLTSNTRVVLGTVGGTGTWYLSPIYPISVGTNTFNFELPHHMVDGILVTLIGTNLPTGLATATSYYVIRIDARTIKLAISRVNAIAGIAITFSGGTVTTFGISGNGFGALSPYSVILQNVSSQNSIQALYLCGASDVKVGLHVENCKSSIYAYQSQLTIDGGAYANAADAVRFDGTTGIWLAAVGFNTRVSICGQPILSGITDKIVASNNASVYSAAAGGLATVGATTSAAKSTGIVQQVGQVGSVLDVGACDFCIVNTSTTPITTISSKLGPRSQIRLVAWGGSIIFSDGGNVYVPGTLNPNTMTFPKGYCVTLEMVDLANTWVIVSSSPYPLLSTTALQPAYIKGGMYFDTTLNKLRIGGATAWETVTSV